MQEHLNRIAPGCPSPDQSVSVIASWVEDQTRMMRFGATLPGPRYLRVKSEHVLNDPRQHLRLIASWLQVSTENAAVEAMTRPEASPFASFGPAESGIVGGHDPNFLRNPVPRPVPVFHTLDCPEGCRGYASLWRTVVAVANQLGYP
jgi:hypothetical protein